MLPAAHQPAWNRAIPTSLISIPRRAPPLPRRAAPSPNRKTAPETDRILENLCVSRAPARSRRSRQAWAREGEDGTRDPIIVRCRTETRDDFSSFRATVRAAGPRWIVVANCSTRRIVQSVRTGSRPQADGGRPVQLPSLRLAHQTGRECLAALTQTKCRRRRPGVLRRRYPSLPNSSSSGRRRIRGHAELEAGQLRRVPSRMSNRASRHFHHHQTAEWAGRATEYRRRISGPRSPATASNSYDIIIVTVTTRAQQEMT